jgi:hypothetical protein
MARTKKTATAETQEVEVQSIPVAEETVAQTSDTENVEIEEKEVVEGKKKPTTAFLKFHKDQAREFLIDEKFVTVVMYKKFDFSFRTSNTIDLTSEKNKIVKSINRVLSLMKVADVITSIHDDTELHYETPNTVFTVFIPYSDKLNIITQNLYRMVDSMNADSNRVVQYRVKTKGIAKIRINKDVNSEKNDFFKGFIATSFEYAIKDENGNILKPAMNYLKSGSYIDADAGLSGKEIGMFNQFNLSLTKVNLFNEPDSKHSEYDYYLNFKKKFRIITYHIYMDEHDQKRAITKVVDINLKLDNIIQTSDAKVVVGFYLNKDVSDKPINEFNDVFINDEGENRIIKYNAIDPNSYEFRTFQSEVDVIEENILSNITVAEPETVDSEEEQTVEVGQLADEPDVVAEE